mmetsp:Transcript_2304/g.4552  ORF Transcript_2304/g.4552 Transcript_2304/m.4552 type:complete len:336 (+) Transcript_2304:237-1244(+)
MFPFYLLLLLLLLPPIGRSGSLTGRPPVIPIHQDALHEKIQNALRQNDPHDIIDLAVVHGNPTVSALPHHPEHARHAHALGHRHDLHPRFHDLANLLILQVQHPLDHLLLAVIDGAGIARSGDDETEFGIGHSARFLRFDAEQSYGRFGEVTQRESQRSDDVRQHVDGGYHQSRHLLGVDHAYVLGKQLHEEQRHGGEKYGGPAFGVRSEDVIGQVSEESRSVDRTRRGGNQYRGQHPRDILVQRLEGAPLPLLPRDFRTARLLLLLGEFAHLPRVERRDGDFGGVQQGEDDEDSQPYGEFGGEFLCGEWYYRYVGVASGDRSSGCVCDGCAGGG